MRQSFLLIAVYGLIFCSNASAQAKMPGFVIADVKGQYHHINKAAIKKPVLLVYFIPDCDDCQAFTAKLSKHNSVFDHYEVIMVTNSNLDALKKFVVDFGLANKPNLMIGTEGWTAALQRLLKVERFPFVAAYNAKGLLIHNFTDPNKLFDQKL
jgi:hypothetical protein